MLRLDKLDDVFASPNYSHIGMKAPPFSLSGWSRCGEPPREVGAWRRSPNQIGFGRVFMVPNPIHPIQNIQVFGERDVNLWVILDSMDFPTWIDGKSEGCTPQSGA
jgi:hypothetical protein